MANAFLGEDEFGKDWTDEERAKVEELMKTVVPPAPEPPPVDLRDHFKPGQTIYDPQGLKIIVLNVGTSAMGVMLKGKKGKFVNGYLVNMAGLAFVTRMSRGRHTTFDMLGPAAALPGKKSKTDDGGK